MASFLRALGKPDRQRQPRGRAGSAPRPWPGPFPLVRRAVDGTPDRKHSRMEKHVKRALLVLLVLGFSAAALSGQQSPNAVPGFRAEGVYDLTDLDQIGLFNGGDYGPFRLVVIRGGVEHVSMRIYAQWLQFDATSGVDSVKLSAPVAELNNSLALVREVEIAEQGSNRIVFSLTCEPRDPGPLERILLELTRPGEMKVFPAGDRAKLATP